MEFLQNPLIIPLGAFITVIVVVMVESLRKLREDELEMQRALRLREMEHQRHMKELEVAGWRHGTLT